MLAALEFLRGELMFDFDVIDVDSDPDALARYDELVPVLEGDGRELCHYFLDEAKVREYLTHFR
jgi:thioredoxin reductase (NADPH)